LGSGADARAQVYISHAGNDLIFRGGWGTSSWQTWNRCLTDQNQPYAYAMNQYVRTTDTCSFAAVTATTFTGALSGNATTATTLQTARNINGTSFNGSAAITTATWGTARTLTIGSTGKSVDGSGNVSWTLAELGAAATNGASNQNFSANSIYPYEWIRFMVDAGIYWQSGTYAGWHIHPQAAWGMSFRSAGATDCGLQLRRSDATSLGAVYSDGTSIGFLTAAFGWGASFTVAGTMNRGTVPLGRIETITAYTILGNNNASAAAVPSALTPAQVATMLSGQTMNIAGSSTSCTGNSATATNAGCITSDTGNVGENRLQYWQTSGNTTLNPDTEWYNAIRMGHGNPVTYYGNTLAVKMTGTNLGDIYTRTLTNGTQGSWNRFWNNNNDGAGSGLDADLVDGLDVHTGRNDNANKIVRTDSNGYIQAGWINTTSGDNGTTAIDRVYASQDGYIRYYTPANFRTVLDVPTRGGSGASGNWAINVTGNAATSTLATKASTLSQGGGNGTGMTFNWSGQSGQPTWLWGSNDGTNIYVWNPSNFNVNSATTATTANALNTSNSYTITGLTSNGTISIFPSYVSPYSSFLRMGYDNSGNYEYTIKRDGTTGFLEFYNTQANYTGYYFRINGSGGGLGIAVSPASRLHVNGDGTNPAVRVDNTGVVLAASVGSNGRTFYGWLPISVDGTTRWIRIFS